MWMDLRFFATFRIVYQNNLHRNVECNMALYFVMPIIKKHIYIIYDHTTSYGNRR